MPKKDNENVANISNIIDLVDRSKKFQFVGPEEMAFHIPKWGNVKLSIESSATVNNSSGVSMIEGEFMVRLMDKTDTIIREIHVSNSDLMVVEELDELLNIFRQKKQEYRNDINKSIIRES